MPLNERHFGYWIMGVLSNNYHLPSSQSDQSQRISPRCAPLSDQVL